MRYSVLLLATLVAQPSLAPAPPPLPANDYARAEKFMGYNTTPLVFGARVRPSWLPGDRFWYHNTIPQGAEFVLVDPARRAHSRAFDHERGAAALSRAADTTYGAFSLPFTQLDFSSDGRSISFDIGSPRSPRDRPAASGTAA